MVDIGPKLFSIWVLSRWGIEKKILGFLIIELEKDVRHPTFNVS